MQKPRLYDRAWGSADRVEKLSRVFFIVVVGTFLALIATTPDRQPPQAFATAVSATTESRSSLPADAPPCRDSDMTQRRVVCRTATKTLAVGREDVPLLLGTTQLRVISVQASGDRVAVRLRVRNTGTQMRATPGGRREAYMNIDGRRIYAAPRASQDVMSGEALTLTYAFVLDDQAIWQLQARGGQTELALAPLGEGTPAESKMLAVTKLQVPVERLAIG
jgi:hypothetical protein